MAFVAFLFGVWPIVVTMYSHCMEKNTFKMIHLGLIFS